MAAGDGAGTRSVHGGERPDPETGALTTPIYRTSTFRFDTTDDLLAGARGERPGFYTRYGHPNFDAVERKFALLHGAEAACLFASGLGAFAGVLFGHVKTGDRVVAARDLYGGTRAALGEMDARYGVRVEFVGAGDEGAFERAVAGARLVVAESPTNPTLRVLDLPRLTSAIRAAGALFLFDNTFAGPLNQQPLRHGVDLVWESATKSLGGHSDLMGGLVAGRAELIEPLRRARKLFGAVLDPDAAWLLARGMKTLPVRIERQNRTAAEVAAFLERHPAVSRVFYPGLPSHPDHALAKRMLQGFGGMVAFACRGGLQAARAVADGVRVIANAPSLGGVESLVSLPLYTSHAMFSEAERAAAGITDDLVRLSIGLEDPVDLVADLDRALRGGAGGDR
jgi:cystathionine beta-lyase/cystathionine gamma-synthase